MLFIAIAVSEALPVKAFILFSTPIMTLAASIISLALKAARIVFLSCDTTLFADPTFFLKLLIALADLSSPAIVNSKLFFANPENIVFHP